MGGGLTGEGDVGAGAGEGGEAAGGAGVRGAEEEGLGIPRARRGVPGAQRRGLLHGARGGRTSIRGRKGGGINNHVIYNNKVAPKVVKN